MKLTRTTIIGILGVVALLLIGAYLPKAFAPKEQPVTEPAYITALKTELEQFSIDYTAKAEQKARHEEALKTISEDLRGLSCKALSTRIVLCQRGMDDFCAQEQKARELLRSSYGASFEDVCRKDFTEQVTGS